MIEIEQYEDTLTHTRKAWFKVTKGTEVVWVKEDGGSQSYKLESTIMLKHETLSQDEEDMWDRDFLIFIITDKYASRGLASKLYVPISENQMQVQWKENVYNALRQGRALLPWERTDDGIA